MNKINKFMLIGGALLVLNGILLLLFPEIMHYPFAAISILAGLVLIVPVLRNQNKKP